MKLNLKPSGFLEKYLTSQAPTLNQLQPQETNRMSLLSHDTFWNALITLPMTKKMLQLSLKKCPTCGRTVLETALDSYAGKTDRDCKKCSVFYSQIIGFWVEFLRRSLNFKREKVEKLLVDPYARRAVMNLAKSFAYFGIKKPISLYAPSLSFGILPINAI